MRLAASRFLSALALAVMAAGSNAAQPSAVLKFKGGIGVDPLTAAGGADALNVVRGVNPGGRAWVIRKLEAGVYADASIVVKGKGLLLSSGDVIATRGAVAQVVATLACGAADATAAKYTSEPVPLNLAGNFKIEGKLFDGANIATLPQPCANPQLLIRAFGAAGPGGWFAVGILDFDEDED